MRPCSLLSTLSSSIALDTWRAKSKECLTTPYATLAYLYDCHVHSVKALTLSRVNPFTALIYWSNPPFLIFDILALRTECQNSRMSKIKIVGYTSMALNSSNLEQMALNGLISFVTDYHLHQPTSSYRWRYGYSIGRAIKRSWVRLPLGHCNATTLGKLFTPLCLGHQAVEVGIGLKTGKVTAGYGRCGLPSITLSVSSLLA